MEILKTLDFINGIEKIYLLSKEEQYSNIFQLCEAVKIIKEKEEKNLPYHINIIDLIWADENAHSRILAHLLKQNDKGKFEILENFLVYLSEINKHFNLKISNPKIYFERHRIDILIEDNDYASLLKIKFTTLPTSTSKSKDTLIS